MSEALPPLTSPDAPAAVKAEMEVLRQELDRTVPSKRDAARNLLIGTWNIKAFASLTERWTARASDNPKRDWRGLWAITEIISRFDVIAVQEAKGNLKSLRTMLKTLGPNWNFLMTDVNRGHSGNDERLAFVFDSTRIALSGLACELVVPQEKIDEGVGKDALKRQFVRPPYAVGFRAGRETFVLVTLHVLFGSRAEQRYPELKAIAEWMADWAKRSTEWEQNFIALGDFNIDRRDSLLWQAFASSGLTIPKQFDDVRRSIFAAQGDNLNKYYDHIAWFEQGDDRKLHMEFVSAGYFDFVPHLYRDAGMKPDKMQHRVSDHYPLWVEFACKP